jgi:D-3-phosphoglycerate dehydrogenase
VGRVVVAEWTQPEGFPELEPHEVVYDPGLWERRDELKAALRDAEALIVRNQARVDADLVEGCASLGAIGRLGVGLDNIDLGETRRRGIPVVYARNANAVSVAEYVMAAVLHCSRDLSEADGSVRRGEWDRRRFTGSEVHGKTLGLVGVGEIGHRVARRATAFGMRVLGHDPYVGPYDFAAVETGVEMTGFDELLALSDFVSIHVPLNAGTRHLFSGPVFGEMKPGAWLINTSRGGVVKEDDLAEALDKGAVRGAVLDVLEEEPPSPGNPLLKHERVVLTPHVAGLTEESQARTSRLVSREVAKVLRGEPSLCVVD